MIGVSSNISRAERERDEANYQYFVSLAESRASLTNLPMMAFLTAIMLGLVAAPIGSMVYFGEHRTGLLPLFLAHLVMIGFSMLLLVATLFQSWVFRYQVLASGLSVFFAVVGWVYALSALALCIAATVPDPKWAFKGGVMVSGERLALFALIGSLYVAGATVVHVLLLRKRLREGHSEERTMGNYLAASSVYSSKSLWIIFAVAVIGPNLLTGGRYVLVTVGTLLFLLFASVLTSLPVEFGYLTYLKARDKKYWERRPPKIVVSRARKIAVLKKVGMWVFIVIAAIAALTFLPLI